MRSTGSTLHVTSGARNVVMRRCGGACEACGLEWPWELYLFRVDEAGTAAAANLRVLCAACSEGHAGPFAPLISTPSLRDRLREANNRRTGAVKLTPARRRRLIATRGSRCEICGVPAGDRQLDVHHRLGVFRGGDDDERNLMVLCFACHHHLQPCATGCGRWAKKPATLCRHCETRRSLEALYPSSSWQDIKARIPALAESWPSGYEPLPAPGRERILG
ncbi:MAG TPA: HNH endonuclease signature motif containing protein [Patescibacteria group bacterium]|nr:HNH endonuclease signature motif containing protein [Patescibacteria group bacterium]